MIKQLYVQTHDVYLNIYPKDGWYLSKNKKNGNITSLAPVEAGLSNANGGMPWLLKVVQSVRNDWDGYPDGFRIGYFGDEEEENTISYRMISRYEDVPYEYQQTVKEIAYELDPECWESYSGKTKQEKRGIEHERKASLLKATKQWRDQF